MAINEFCYTLLDLINECIWIKMHAYIIYTYKRVYMQHVVCTESAPGVLAHVNMTQTVYLLLFNFLYTKTQVILPIKI